VSLEERQERLRSALAERELDVLVVTALTNVRYLTGYVGSSATAVLGPADAALLTDFRYAVSAREQVAGAEVVITGHDALEGLVARLEALPPETRIGIEAEHVSLARHQRLVEAIDGRELVPTTGVVEDLRLIKAPEEIAAIRRAAEAADAALAAVLATPPVGRREGEVAWEIEGALRSAGAEAASFEPIVAAGSRGARPHHMPGDEPIPDDTLLTIDLGAVVDGYCSDMTRTIPLGTPAPELIRAYNLCHRAQQAALEAVRPGIAASALDAVAREIISEAGLGEAFEHGLGHGVGLDIHERPRVGRGATETLAPGMVVTIEPGIYLEGVGGVRIEDLVVVTEDGCEVLSRHPKAPPV
jgi:Xaa-Pro aminopeptidase